MGLRGPLERMLTVDQVHVLRHKVLVEGRSQRQVATELGISRRTVRKYLTEPVPIRREAHPRARPVWTRVQARVEALLAEPVDPERHVVARPEVFRRSQAHSDPGRGAGVDQVAGLEDHELAEVMHQEVRIEQHS